MKLFKIMLLFFGILPALAFSQSTKTYVIRDVESWTGIAIKYDYSKKLTLGLSENMRLEHNSGQLQQHFTEMSVKYEWLKNWFLVPELRLGFRNSDETSQFYNRVFLSSNYKLKMDRITVNPRIAYQRRSVSAADSAIANDIGISYRYRLGFGYNVKNWKLDPELSFELFRNATAKNGPEFSKYRLKLSTDIEISKKWELGVFYAFEHELNASYPLNLSIVGVKLNFSTKKNKKSLKEDL